jgi:hypothetical protein
MREFAKYQIALNRTFPTGKDVFLSEMYEFLLSANGKFLRKHVGFEKANADGSVPKMFYHRISADSSLNYPAVARTARPVFERWESGHRGYEQRCASGRERSVQHRVLVVDLDEDARYVYFHHSRMGNCIDGMFCLSQRRWWRTRGKGYCCAS